MCRLPKREEMELQGIKAVQGARTPVIVFEEAGASEAWCFPRSHLISFEADDTRVKFEFLGHTVTVLASPLVSGHRLCHEILSRDRFPVALPFGGIRVVTKQKYA